MKNLSIPLHFVSGLALSGKSSIVKELLASSPEGERIGVIQSLKTPEAIDPLAYPQHRFEQIRSSSCVCCEIFLLFYARMISLLQSEPLDCILVELGHEADISQLKGMLQNTPMIDKVHWGKTLISFDIRDRRFRPYAVMPAINRMMDQADALIMRFSDLAQEADREHFQRHKSAEKKYFYMNAGADPHDLRRFMEQIG